MFSRSVNQHHASNQHRPHYQALVGLLQFHLLGLYTVNPLKGATKTSMRNPTAADTGPPIEPPITRVTAEPCTAESKAERRRFLQWSLLSTFHFLESFKYLLIEVNNYLSHLLKQKKRTARNSPLTQSSNTAYDLRLSR